VYCQGQFSVQGDYVKKNKKAKWEQENRGKSCIEVWTKEKKARALLFLLLSYLLYFSLFMIE
jgi:hypothetical protein